MKTPCSRSQCRAVLAGLALVALAGTARGQIPLVGSFTNNFDTGGRRTNFAGVGSVAGWYYWYNTAFNGSPMTNDVSLDVNNDTNSGCLMVVSPFDTNYGQNVFFGTFATGFPFDFGEVADLSAYGSITFYIRMAPGTPPRQVNGTSVNFGTIGVGIITSGYAYQELGRPTIPLSASNAWVLMTVLISPGQPGLTNVPGIAFDISSYDSGYPQFVMTSYIDSLQVNALPGNEVTLKLSPPWKPIAGLNAIAATPGGAGEFNRYQVATAANTGYSFVGQPRVTYSWNIESFPTSTSGLLQQHFFIVGGSPGAYDQSPDYILPDCLFMTIQQSDAGVATFDFRYKTNEPFGNAMIYNAISPTDTINNPNAWPVEPIASLTTTAGAVGTWSVSFVNGTNVTVTASDGSSTNFNIPAAVAALFADPATLLLGAQPNDPNNAGKLVAIGNFSASGCATPFSDNFATDLALNTNLWQDLSVDTNGLVLVPPTAAYWLSWPNPQDQYVLETTTNVSPPVVWTPITPPTIVVNNQRWALIDSSELLSPAEGEFQVIQLQFYQLHVLLAGEIGEPDTPAGKAGMPLASSLTTNGGYVTVTINAVDASYNPDAGVTDMIRLTSSADPNAVEPPDAALVNGTLTEQVKLENTGSWTITAQDTTFTNVRTATSSSVMITP